MRCTRCGWPVGETAVLSTHHTSEGWVRYRRCLCGTLSIELVQLAGRADLRVDTQVAASAPAPGAWPA